MTQELPTVVVLAWRGGREVVPTVRSIRRANVGIELFVICSPSTVEIVRAWMSVHDPAGKVVESSSEEPDGLFAEALELGTAPTVALMDAGDLTDLEWLPRGASLASLAECVVRPERILTFGRRSGEWLQRTWYPGDSSVRALARYPVWGSPVVVPRTILRRVPPRTGPSGLRLWVHELIAAGIPQRTVPAAVFVRVWTDRAPWEPLPPMMRQSALLTDPTLASSDAAPSTTRPHWKRRWPAGVRRATAFGREALEPWRGAVRRLKVRRAGSRFSRTLKTEWRALNAIEPLVPFPRADVDVWYERVCALGGPELREVDAYWRLVGGGAGTVDYLYFAPWVRTGGGDAVLAQYVASVARLSPDSRILVITTEPEISTRAYMLTGNATVLELAPMLAEGVHRDAFVEWIVPQVVAQSRPRVLHAFNSTVALDVIERWGDELAARTRLFLSTFAIDRSADGERLSVLFLRPPAFLDPFTAVLVDSSRFVDVLVKDHGYDRRKFVVQRTAVRERTVQPQSAAAQPRVFWAGRFDTPKRLDIFASVVDRLRDRAPSVRVDVYGEPVMGTRGLGDVLAILQAAGVEMHPPFAQFDDLPLEDMTAYVSTSEWEGVPLTMLDAMSAGIPVVASLVGGVGEVLDADTGYPVEDFADTSAYVDAIASILDNPDEARRRAAAARWRVRTHFSQDAFDDTLRQLGYIP